MHQEVWRKPQTKHLKPDDVCHQTKHLIQCESEIIVKMKSGSLAVTLVDISFRNDVLTKQMLSKVTLKVYFSAQQASLCCQIYGGHRCGGLLLDWTSQRQVQSTWREEHWGCRFWVPWEGRSSVLLLAQSDLWLLTSLWASLHVIFVCQAFTNSVHEPSPMFLSFRRPCVSMKWMWDGQIW